MTTSINAFLQHFYDVPSSAARDVLVLSDASFAYGGQNLMFRQQEARQALQGVLAGLFVEEDDLEMVLLRAAQQGDFLVVNLQRINTAAEGWVCLIRRHRLDQLMEVLRHYHLDRQLV